jgi:hypothetical protein
MQSIQYLNDTFRQTFSGGKVVLSRGVGALPETILFNVLSLVQTYKNFNNANDPYKEHDFGIIEYHEHTIFWKIDYYDKDYRYASSNPADETLTNRVLTVMLAEEY